MTNNKEYLKQEIETENKILLEKLENNENAKNELIDVLITTFYDVKTKEELKQLIKANENSAFPNILSTTHLKNYLIMLKLLNKGLNNSKLKEQNSKNDLAKEISTLSKESFITKQKILKKTYQNPKEDLIAKTVIKRSLNNYENLSREDLEFLESSSRKSLTNILAMYNRDKPYLAYKACMETFYRGFYNKTAKEILKENKIPSLNKFSNLEHLKYKNSALYMINNLLWKKKDMKELLASIKNFSKVTKEYFIEENDKVPYDNLKDIILIRKASTKAVTNSNRKKIRKEKNNGF